MAPHCIGTFGSEGALITLDIYGLVFRGYFPIPLGQFFVRKPIETYSKKSRFLGISVLGIPENIVAKHT